MLHRDLVIVMLMVLLALVNALWGNVGDDPDELEEECE